MTLREIMVGYPGTKDIRVHPYYRGPLSRWVWKLYHHRFTRAGRWFLGVTAMVAFVFGLYWSLDTQTWIALVFCFGVWMVSLPAFVLAPRVRIEARHADRVAAGVTLAVDVTVTNVGRFPFPEMALHPWGLPQEVDAESEEGVPLGSLRPGESVRVRVPLRARSRGAFVLGGWRVDTDFPFGLICAYRIVRQPSPLVVHPAWTPLSRLELPQGRRHQPGGIALAAKVGDAFEYAGNREWRSGDRPRDVDWRATARHLGSPTSPLVVREWREEYFLRVGVVLDTFLPAEPPPSPLFGRRRMRQAQRRRDALERAVSLCAALGDALSERDYLVDLFAAGPEVFHLTAGRGLATRDQILDILACVAPTDGETLSRIAPQLAEHLERLTTLVLVATRWDEARQGFVDALRQRGVGVRTILVIPDGEEAPASTDDVRVFTPDQVAAGVDAL